MLKQVFMPQFFADLIIGHAIADIGRDGIVPSRLDPAGMS